MQGHRVDTFLLIVILLVVGADIYIVSVDEVVLRSRTLDYEETSNSGWFKDVVSWTLILGGAYFAWLAVSGKEKYI